jgi:hypothetical protein
MIRSGSLLSVALTSIALSAAVASAQQTSFETGLDGYTITGEGGRTTGGPGIVAPAESWFAYVSTHFYGVSDLVSPAFAVTSPVSVTFYMNFLTYHTPGFTHTYDWGAVLLEEVPGPGVSSIAGIGGYADSYGPGATLGGSSYEYQTGWRFFSHSIMSPGDYRLLFRVQVGTPSGPAGASALAVDQIRFRPLATAPEPGSTLLLLGGLVGVALVVRRRAA